MAKTEIMGLVADVGGTNTRLAFAGPDGVIEETVARCANADFDSFEHLLDSYLAGRPAGGPVVIAVAGPVNGGHARLTNRNWVIEADALAATLGVPSVTLMNDLEALGHAIPTLPASAAEALHTGASLDQAGQSLVVGLGTGFNVAAVDTRSGAVMIAEKGHASLPASVVEILSAHLPDTSSFSSVENLFSGVGLLRAAHVIGVDVPSAEALALSDDPRARETIDVITEAFGQMVKELAFTYFPRAGLYFNGSLAQFLLSPERRARVLAPLRAEARFDGQFASIPAFLLVSHTVALGGAAARLRTLVPPL